MKKLFTLGEKQWKTGVAPSAHISDQGIFFNARGVTPFVNPLNPTTVSQSGLLQANAARFDATSYGGGQVVDTIWSGINSYKSFGSVNFKFMQGSSGHFYQQDLSSDNGPTDLRSATPITDQASGLAVYQAAGGTRYLYYAQKTKIGRWDIGGGDTYPTYWTDNYIGPGGTINDSGIVSTTIHPMHSFAGSVWMGNGNKVAKITDAGGGNVSFASAELDLDADFIITSINDDGRYLVITACKNGVSGNPIYPTETAIFFWDMISVSWNQSWSVYDVGIAGIQNVAGSLYAVGSMCLYAFDFSTPPVALLNLGSRDMPGVAPGSGPTHYLVSNLNGVLYWGSQYGVCSFGSVIPGQPKAFLQPFYNTDYPTTFFQPGSSWKFYLANSNSKFYFYNRLSGGATGVSAKTIYVPLEHRSQIKRIDVVLGEPLATGDELRLDTQTDDATAATTWGTASYSVNGAVRKVSLYSAANNVDSLSLIFNFVGGNVKIKEVIVYGENEET